MLQRKVYLQLEGRYLAKMLPLQTQSTCPVEAVYVPVSVIVLASMFESPVAVAVMMPVVASVSAYAVADTFLVCWLLMAPDAVVGMKP